ncbi:MAG TPA: type IX secretion system protein PorQ [Chitinophagaceae bacterium]|nr:type IX secretion system protein PorQ [Chitinophagaceae bacterium]
MQRCIFLFAFFSIFSATSGQTLGGSSVFNFLKLPNTSQLTALGGINISNITDDIGMSFNNPALLRPTMHGQLSTVFNSMYAGIKNFHLMAGFSRERLKTTFAGGVQYLNYGSIPQTNAAGNILGSFRPGDYVAQISASRKYMNNWFYGISLKFINSNYGLYRSNGIAMDAGFSYYDSTSLLQLSLVMKNMGVQLKKYDGTTSDELPFDVQVGITRRLQKAPIQFSITAHHLHRLYIRYIDTTFNNDNGFNQDDKPGKFSIDDIFQHFIVAAQFFAGDKIEVTTAYNRLRRAELNITGSPNGMNGFSLGVGVLFRKLEMRYARAYYQNNTAYNQFGLNIKLDEYFGSGNSAER